MKLLTLALLLSASTAHADEAAPTLDANRLLGLQTGFFSDGLVRGNLQPVELGLLYGGLAGALTDPRAVEAAQSAAAWREASVGVGTVTLGTLGLALWSTRADSGWSQNAQIGLGATVLASYIAWFVCSLRTHRRLLDALQFETDSAFGPMGQRLLAPSREGNTFTRAGDPVPYDNASMRATLADSPEALRLFDESHTISFPKVAGLVLLLAAAGTTGYLAYNDVHSPATKVGLGVTVALIVGEFYAIFDMLRGTERAVHQWNLDLLEGKLQGAAAAATAPTASSRGSPSPPGD